MKKLIIAADNKIPALKGLIEKYAEVKYLPAKEFTPETIGEANVLLVRTPTKCTRQLLENSKVEYIGTANIGFDHIDREFCAAHNIAWHNAPGCNAVSVAQYVLSALQFLSVKENYDYRGKTIGIVGAGNIGTCVADACRKMGLRILLNDPPRALAEGSDGFVDLKTIAEESDIISFHTPMVHTGAHKTYHLADELFFFGLKKKPYIINAARGGIINEPSLLHAYNQGLVSGMIIDCWENEPDMHPVLLDKAILATPHIAGFSTDGKMNATRITLQYLSAQFDIPMDLSSIVPPQPEQPVIDLSQTDHHRIEKAILTTYDIEVDSNKLKQHPHLFVSFRDNYYLRREFRAYTVAGASPEEAEILQKLGFNISK